MAYEVTTQKNKTKKKIEIQLCFLFRPNLVGGGARYVQTARQKVYGLCVKSSLAGSFVWIVKSALMMIMMMRSNLCK